MYYLICGQMRKKEHFSILIYFGADNQNRTELSIFTDHYEKPRNHRENDTNHYNNKDTCLPSRLCPQK
jgi:hypothetical protein